MMLKTYCQVQFEREGDERRTGLMGVVYGDCNLCLQVSECGDGCKGCKLPVTHTTHKTRSLRCSPPNNLKILPKTHLQL